MVILDLYSNELKSEAMKKLSFFLALLLSAPAFSSHSQAPNYNSGDVLNVVALSGLRLRMQPRMDAPTIRVVPYYDSVTVVESLDDGTGYIEKINWMEGHWVKVKYRGTVGYLFDAFVSNMKPPVHEDQLCYSRNELSYSIEQYINSVFTVECIEDGPDANEELAQVVTQYFERASQVKTAGEGWYQVKYEFEGYRYSEILNLMRQLLVGDDLRSDFENALVYHTSRTGRVTRIDINFGDFPIVMDITDDMVITLSSTIVTETDCC